MTLSGNISYEKWSTIKLIVPTLFANVEQRQERVNSFKITMLCS
jgi:hypothetical protein